MSALHILRLPEVCKKTGLKKTSIYRLGAKGDFPKPVKLTSRSSGWLSTEIDNWLESRQRADLQEHATY